MFTSGAYTLQEDTTAGELFVKAQYHCSMKIYTNWYWNQKPKNHVITLLTRTILHLQLEVNSVIDFHGILTSVCTKTQAKNPYQDSLYV